MLATSSFFEHQFPPHPKKGFFFPPLSGALGALLGLFIAWSNTDYLQSWTAALKDHEVTPTAGGSKEVDIGISTTGVHCRSGLPPSGQNLAPCLAQSVCPITKLIRTHAHTWSQAQVRSYTCTPCLSYTDEYTHTRTQTSTQASTYAHTVPLHAPHHSCPSTHVPGWVQTPTCGHHILTTHEAAGPCSALNTPCTLATSHSPSGAYTTWWRETN